MSFDNKYKNRKDHRKQYHDSRSFDRSCRSHGSCPYCENGRTFFDKKNRYFADDEVKQFNQNEK